MLYDCVHGRTEALRTAYETRKLIQSPQFLRRAHDSALPSLFKSHTIDVTHTPFDYPKNVDGA